MVESSDDLGLASAVKLACLIADRTIGARELLDHYLERIGRLDDELNSVITFDIERAQQTAHDADAKTAAGAELGPLHGLPITVKDAIATKGIRSTGGAVELKDHIPTEDAPVVQRVKTAGANVFAKTNLPPWSGDIQTFNPMFGTTNNPWDISRTPGGSSGGASTAVAMGFTSFEMGTDLAGSVRLPAHFSGVCGHKPSFGIVPQFGYLDHSTAGSLESDVNVFGPLARSVADLELLLDLMSGPTDDRATAWELSLPPARHDELGDFRVAAWLDDPSCPTGSKVASVLDEAVSALSRAGAAVDRAARPDVPLESASDTGLPLISATTSPAWSDNEWADQLSRAATDHGSSTIRHRDWLLLTKQRTADRHRWANFFKSYDVLLCPVAISEAIPHNQDGGFFSRTITVNGQERPYTDLVMWTSMIGYVYLPATVVPVGFTGDGLPVGIQVVAPFLEDRTALGFARHIEAICGGYRPPPLATSKI
ncbi:MAG: amidase [Acidimicrobiales bacterium]